MKKFLLLLSLIPTFAFGASNVRTEKQETLFQKGVAYTRRDESSGATLNAMAITQTYIKLASVVSTVNGMAAPTASESPKFVLISNMTGGTVVFAHASASATAANRFDLPEAKDLEVLDRSSASFIYDHVAERWVVAGGGGGGGAAFTAVAPIDYDAGTELLTCDVASGSQPGCLAAADWTTFNSKQAGDAGLTSLAGLSTTNAFYYLSAADVWSQVMLGQGLDFTTGTLSVDVVPSEIPYTPTTADDWLEVPSDAQEALDNLAAQRPVINAGGSWVGGITWAINGSCTGWTTGGTSYATVAADADCVPTVLPLSEVSAPGTNIFGITFTADPRYEYVIKTNATIHGQAQYNGSSRFFDGTTASSEIPLFDLANAGSSIPSGEYSYVPATSGSKTLSFQMKASSGVATQRVDGDYVQPRIDIYKYPRSSSTTVDIFEAGDYGWTEYTMVVTATTTNPTLPTATVNKAQHKRVGDTLFLRWQFAHAAGSGGNDGSGDYIFSLPPGISFASDQVVGTSLTSSSGNILQSTGSRTINSGGVGTVGWKAFARDSTHFMLTDALGSVNGNFKSGDSLFTRGSGASFEVLIVAKGADSGGDWSTFPIGVASELKIRIVSATVAAPSAGACAVSNELSTAASNDWLNGNGSSGATGDCLFTINASVFSGAPNCVATGAEGTSSDDMVTIDTSTAPSATAIRVQGIAANTGATRNVGFHIQCTGPRL